jgi:hypothetical protein
MDLTPIQAAISRSSLALVVATGEAERYEAAQRTMSAVPLGKQVDTPTCDRDDFPDFTRESPIDAWYMHAIKLLLTKLGPTEFIGLISVVYKNGKADGDAEARADIRRVLGVS